MARKSKKRAVVKTDARTIAPAAGKREFAIRGNHLGVILGIILAIAAGLRFYEIARIPPGLYVDEAADGANALQSWETGDFQVFYPEDNGREGLYTNIASVFIHFLGAKAWVLRLPAGLFGFLTVGGIYLLTAELISPPAGLAAAFFLATSFWHTNFSRIAFRAIAAPFFLVFALYFLLLSFRRIRHGRGFAVQVMLAGVIYGLGFHTYIAYRVTPLLIVLLLAFIFADAARGGWMRRYWNGLGLFTVAAAVVMYPLVAYLVSHPDIANKRTSQVSVFQSANPTRVIATNIWKTVGMVYWKGDGNGRHNVQARPEVFWPVALLMTFGAVAAIRRMRLGSPRAEWMCYSLIFLWMVCGAVPAVLSDEGIPHALRSILLLPPITILAAIGTTTLLSALRTAISTPVLALATVAAGCALTGEAVHTYFYLWATSPDLPKLFEDANASVADRINSLPKGRPIVVAIQGPREVADPFFLPLLSLRYLTRSVTTKEQTESNIHFYTPTTFPRPIPGADFCAGVTAAMPEAVVACLGF